MWHFCVSFIENVFLNLFKKRKGLVTNQVVTTTKALFTEDISMIEWEQCSNKLDQSLVLTLCWCPFGLKAYSWTQKKLAVILHTCNITYERTVTNEYKVQAKFPFRIISRLHYHKWAHSTSRFVWKALFLASLQTSQKSCQQYINE